MLRNQRGDTLVEVAIALTIMSAVLTSAFYLANRSIQVGRLAKERNLLVTAAQTQAESLAIMRDRLGWAVFSNKVDSYAGACFYLDASLVWQTGSYATPSVNTGQICVKASNVAGQPNMRQFNINYTAQEPSSPNIDTTLISRLGNIDALRAQVAP